MVFFVHDKSKTKMIQLKPNETENKQINENCVFFLIYFFKCKLIFLTIFYSFASPNLTVCGLFVSFDLLIVIKKIKLHLYKQKIENYSVKLEKKNYTIFQKIILFLFSF